MKESACQFRRCRRHSFDPWVRKIPLRRKWQPTPVFLPGKSHGQRSLVGYSLWGFKELDIVGLLGLAGSPNFRFPLKWWDSPPPSGNLEPANQYAPSKKQRES